MKTIKKYFNFFLLLVLSPFMWATYLASGLMPRSKKIWVFGGWDGFRFADNTKWFFLHCNRSEYPEKFIWISRDTEIVKLIRDYGFEAYHYSSLKGLWHCLRAKFYIFDHDTRDINYYTSFRAIKINLYHGIAFKKLRRDIENPDSFNYKVLKGSLLYRLFFFIVRPYYYGSFDYFLSTSPVISDNFSSAFDVPDENMSIQGYPRNDVMLDKSISLTDSNQEINEEFNAYKKEGKKIIIYLPTWRDYYSKFLEHKINDEKRDYDIDWIRLNKFCEENNVIFLYKFHNYDYDTLNSDSEGHLQNIFKLDHSVDIYPLLRITDVLITDYSSISFDFLLTKRPIVYYCYDLEEYIDARSFYYDYEKVTPGEKAKNFDELLGALKKALDKNAYFEKWKSLYEETTDLCHTYTDSNSRKRLYKDLKNRFD